MSHPDHFSHALRLRTNLRVAEEATNVFSYLIEGDVKMDEAVSRMKQARMIKAMIPREKGRRAKGMKQGNNVRTIFHSQTADFDPDLSNAKLSSAQSFAFDGANVFVENIHAARCRRADFSISASLASWTTSAMAAA